MSLPSNLVTGDLCDAHKANAGGSFRVLPPVYRDYGKRTRFAGTIATVKCYEDNSFVKAALEEPGGGRVLVVDGCVRDSAELIQCDIGIRALALIPMPTERRQQGERDVALHLHGVWVMPGEWLVADEDGIVVMPAAA